MAFGVLHAYNVSWLWHGCSETVPQPADVLSIPNFVCALPPEDEQVMLETCKGP
jgi:hypothetical protein